MPSETNYYCPICLMDTAFRVVGEGARRTWICSECCVEFTQEPQPSSSTQAFPSRSESPPRSPLRDLDSTSTGSDLDRVEHDPHPTMRRIDTAVFDTADDAAATLERPPVVSGEPRPEGPERDVTPRSSEHGEHELPLVATKAPVAASVPSIGVLGPTSGGKSIFIARLIDRLSRSPIVLEDGAELFATPYQDVGNWAGMEQEVLTPLREGRWPANTPRPQSRRIDVRLRSRSRRGGQEPRDFGLRFLDCAGETLLGWLMNQRQKKTDPQFDPIFESEELTATHRNIDDVMRRSRGLLLLVSPEHSPRLGTPDVARPGEDFAGYFFQYLFDFQAELRVKYHIAIAFTKYDRFRGLIDRNDPGEFARSYFPRMHSTLDGFFDGQYRYFAMSAVGHILKPLDLDGRPRLEPGESQPNEDGCPAPHAVPVGVEEPILWLLQRLRDDGQLDDGIS